MTGISGLFAKLAGASFANLGNLYLGPSWYVKLSPAAYLGTMAAGAVWLLVAGWFAYRVLMDNVRKRRETRGLFLASLAFYAVAGGYATLVYPPTTDEPHYLMIAESLLNDGDIELSGNYASGAHLKFYPNPVIDPHTVITADGKMYSQHTAGLPLIVLPGYALAGRWGVVLILAFVAAALVSSLFRLCLMAGAPRPGALRACILLAATGPLLFGSTLVFTETAAALVLTYALLNLESAAAAAPASAILPWLHPRFAVLSAGLMLLNMTGKPPRERARNLGVWLAAGGISAGFFLCVYHGPALTAVLNVLTEKYPASIADLRGGSLMAVSFGNPLTALLGKLFDRDFGLFPYSPWTIVLVPGILAAARAPRTQGRAPVGRWFAVSASAYFLLTLLFRNWGGSAYPGRTLVPLMPFLAVWLAFGMDWADKTGTRRLAVAVLAAVSLATGWVLTACPVLRYTSGRDWMAGHLGRARLAAPFNWFPTFRNALGPEAIIGLMFIAVAASAALVILGRTARIPRMRR